MKINTIVHQNSQKERKNDINRSQHNKSHEYHPFIHEREYIRALNATKIERMLAKPFISALTYHQEGITSVEKDRCSDLFMSSSFNGQVFVWDLKRNKSISELNFPKSPSGCCFVEKGALVGVGNKIFHYSSDYKTLLCDYESSNPINVLCSGRDFAAGTMSGAEIFDLKKKVLKHKYGLGCVSSISYNPIVEDLLAFGENKDIVLVDHRVNSEFLRINVGVKTNSVKFSPKNGHIIASGNEDSNLYFHDIRHTDRPFIVFKQHLNSITSLDFSHDGKKVTTGSFDRTIRIFDWEDRKCRAL